MSLLFNSHNKSFTKISVSSRIFLDPIFFIGIACTAEVIQRQKRCEDKLWTVSWEGYGRRYSWPVSNYYPVIRLERL